MFLATRLKGRGLKVRSLMGAIAADAMRYFMVIFSAHFVLVMTLNLGPVRTTVLFSKLRPILSNTSLARNRFNSFQARKSRTSCLARSYSHDTFSSRQSAVFRCKSCANLRYTTHGQFPLFFRYLPVMISRIMISLKKAADSQRKAWTLTDSTVAGPGFQSAKFFGLRRDTNERQHDIPLDTYVESQLVVQ